MLCFSGKVVVHYRSMKIQIFESEEEVNKFLEHRPSSDVVDIKFQTQVIGETMDTKTGRKAYTLIDRFLVIVR